LLHFVAVQLALVQGFHFKRALTRLDGASPDAPKKFSVMLEGTSSDVPRIFGSAGALPSRKSPAIRYSPLAAVRLGRSLALPIHSFPRPTPPF
jgi:hypothetical protein